MDLRKRQVTPTQEDPDEAVFEIKNAEPPNSHSARIFVGRTLSILYGVVVTVIGIVFPMAMYLRLWPTKGTGFISAFYIYMLSMSICLMLYIHWRLVRFRTIAQSKFRKFVIDSTATDFHDSVDNILKRSMKKNLGSSPLVQHTTKGVDGSTVLEKPFYMNEEGISLFLRIGLIGFALVSVLVDGFHTADFIFNVSGIMWDCYGIETLIIYNLRIVFFLSESYIIFKYHRFMLNFQKPLMNLAMVHLIATNLCMWALTVIFEAVELYLASGEIAVVESVVTEVPSSVHVEVPHRRLLAATEGNHYAITLENCLHQKTISGSAAPYMFPFMIELSLVAAAVFYRMLGLIGDKKEKMRERQLTPLQDNIKIYGGECHRSIEGLFIGLVLLSAIFVAVCIFVLEIEGALTQSGDFLPILFFSSSTACQVVGLLAALAVGYHVRKLTFHGHLHSSLDQNLIIISLGGSTFYSAFTLIAAAKGQAEVEGMNTKPLLIVLNSLIIVQSLLQVALICDSLRRKTTNAAQAFDKPGRGAVMFLLLVNFAMWLVNTFMFKQMVYSEVLRDFFGPSTWVLITNIFLPIVIFFRFHSVVCLEEVWNESYQWEGEGKIIPIPGSNEGDNSPNKTDVVNEAVKENQMVDGHLQNGMDNAAFVDDNDDDCHGNNELEMKDINSGGVSQLLDDDLDIRL